MLTNRDPGVAAGRPQEDGGCPQVDGLVVGGDPRENCDVVDGPILTVRGSDRAVKVSQSGWVPQPKLGPATVTNDAVEVGELVVGLEEMISSSLAGAKRSRRDGVDDTVAGTEEKNTEASEDGAREASSFSTCCWPAAGLDAPPGPRDDPEGPSG